MKFFDETQARHIHDYDYVIFVFGSNMNGRHGAGAALYAKNKYKAEYGVGVGRTGNAYAIPTKGAAMDTLPLGYIEERVVEFLAYARHHTGLVFFVTRIGCGLAGYSDTQIAPFFRGAPENCIFDIKWKPFLI